MGPAGRGRGGTGRGSRRAGPGSAGLPETRREPHASGRLAAAATKSAAAGTTWTRLRPEQQQQQQQQPQRQQQPLQLEQQQQSPQRAALGGRALLKKEAARPRSPPPLACSCPRGECAHPEFLLAATGQAGWAPWRRWRECRRRALGAHCIPTSCLPLFPPSTLTRDSGLGWARWAGGTKGRGAQVPQRSGGFVYKQWGAGSAAPPGGQCGPGEVSRPRLPRPPQSGRGGAGVWHGGAATPGARARWGRRQGAARGPRSLRLLRAGAAPQQQPVIGPAFAWRAGRAHVAAAGWGGGCDSAGGRLAPPWERACAGLWICRCLAWVCACVWLRVCAGVCREWWCRSGRGV